MGYKIEVEIEKIKTFLKTKTGEQRKNGGERRLRSRPHSASLRSSESL
jgi:hypothetical protein